MGKVTREQFYAAAINLVGTPYIYGGRGIIENEPGVDCSGLVALAFWNAGMKEAGKKMAGLSTQGMMTSLPGPVVGDSGPLLAFYGDLKNYPMKATHVVICLALEGPVLSASGGSPEVDTLPEAHERDAKVKAWASVYYRKDFLCWRSLREFFK